MKLYLYIGAIVAALSFSGYLYVKGRIDGKAAVYAKLEKDHISLVKDGIAIDKEVLSADDSTLLCMLSGDCLPNKEP